MSTIFNQSHDSRIRRYVIASQGVDNNRPAWSPDGKRIAFYSDTDGPLNIFWQSSDGSGTTERLTTSPTINAPISFSPDGKFLAYNDVNPATKTDIALVNVGDRKTQIFLRTSFNEGSAKFSPDGHWMPMPRTSRATGKFTRGPFQVPEVNRKSRRTVEPSLSGIPTAGSCFTATEKR